MSAILVTGGAGYIGSHTVIALYEAGHTAVIVDNLVNSNAEAVKRVGEIVGQEIPFYELDCTDKAALAGVFDKHTIDGAIHFAALKSVSESVAKPLDYYQTNLGALLTLCEVMEVRGVHNLIFSSSATVYGPPSELPLTEDSRVGVGLTNPYGQTKFMGEQILRDLSRASKDWHITLLRYFNPVGAHSSGRIGEDPNGKPNNLMPYVARVAVGKLPVLEITGNDYDTPDGTGVRDYIHVTDLAAGHVAALDHLADKGIPGEPQVYNLGTGKGVSVLEAVHAFEKACGHDIPHEFVERRPGDIATVYADPAKAERELGWKARLSFEQACEDSWRWQSQNPDGYR
jgi:UDP-glucose 4-epimerase